MGDSGSDDIQLQPAAPSPKLFRQLNMVRLVLHVLAQDDTLRLYRAGRRLEVEMVSLLFNATRPTLGTHCFCQFS